MKFRVNAFAYDCSRREVVTFGGSTESLQPKFSNETWLWRQGKWIQAHPSHSPPARASALIGYDPAEHIVVLVGGGSGYVGNERIYLSDTWAWDGADWSQQLGPAAASPSRVKQPALDSLLQDAFAYYPPMRGMVLTGLDGTWLFRAGSWARLADPSPVATYFGPAMAYLPAIGKLLLYIPGCSCAHNTFLFDGHRWTLDPSGDWTNTVPGYWGMVYDAAHHDVAWVAGQVRNSASAPLSSDVLTNDGSGWVVHPAILPHDDTLRTVGIVYDSALGSIVMFGVDPAGNYGSWIWSGEGWALM